MREVTFRKIAGFLELCSFTNYLYNLYSLIWISQLFFLVKGTFYFNFTKTLQFSLFSFQRKLTSRVTTQIRCKCHTHTDIKRISILPGTKILCKVGKAFMVNKSQASENYFGKENFKITLKIFNNHDLCRNLEITQKLF